MVDGNVKIANIVLGKQFGVISRCDHNACSVNERMARIPCWASARISLASIGMPLAARMFGSIHEIFMVASLLTPAAGKTVEAVRELWMAL
jgi:hypothetical protein